MAVLRAPSEHHCSDVLIFQTQPYSLFRYEQHISASASIHNVAFVLSTAYWSHAVLVAIACCVHSVTRLNSFNGGQRDTEGFVQTVSS